MFPKIKRLPLKHDTLFRSLSFFLTRSSTTDKLAQIKLRNKLLIHLANVVFICKKPLTTLTLTLLNVLPVNPKCHLNGAVRLWVYRQSVKDTSIPSSAKDFVHLEESRFHMNMASFIMQHFNQYGYVEDGNVFAHLFGQVFKVDVFINSQNIFEMAVRTLDDDSDIHTESLYLRFDNGQYSLKLFNSKLKKKSLELPTFESSKSQSQSHSLLLLPIFSLCKKSGKFIQYFIPVSPSVHVIHARNLTGNKTYRIGTAKDATVNIKACYIQDKSKQLYIVDILGDMIRVPDTDTMEKLYVVDLTNEEIQDPEDYLLSVATHIH